MMRSLRNVDQTRLPIRAATFVTLVCLAILALSGWREWGSRNTALKSAEADMSNLARSLTQHAEDTLELADAVLIGMVDRLETDGTRSVATARLQTFIDLRKATLARIRGLFVYGEDGQWLLTTEKVELARFNNSDRDYFQRHRESADRKTLIGRPVQSRSGGQWILTLSRRFNHQDGSFAGVALMTIDATYFSNFYAKFEIVPTAQSHCSVPMGSSSPAAPTMEHTSGATCRPLRFSKTSGPGPPRASIISSRLWTGCSG
jgi:hypothetical protein